MTLVTNLISRTDPMINAIINFFAKIVWKLEIFFVSLSRSI